MVQMLSYLGCITEKYYGSHWNSSHTLHSKDGMVLAMKSTGRLMGGVAVDPTCTFFIIDNATNGFSLHCMDDAVALAEEATVVVSGGEDGWVHVFDRTTGQVSQTLQHSKSGRVQMVTTHNTRSIHLILAATSSNEIETWISVWRKEARTPPTPERCGELKLLSMLVTIVVVAILAIQIMTGSAKMGTMYGSMQKKSCLELHILQPRW
ncbi:hypothetical protein EDD16DRAFT_1523646 [Pisolithus croceorrhizus]|nr:hypothetical protein EDD16DRAFT_1523646 [Pisolithus croceorrhizus]